MRPGSCAGRACALKPVNARLDALQATVDAVAEAEGVAPDKAHKSKKHSR